MISAALRANSHILLLFIMQMLHHLQSALLQGHFLPFLRLCCSQQVVKQTKSSMSTFRAPTWHQLVLSQAMDFFQAPSDWLEAGAEGLTKGVTQYNFEIFSGLFRSWEKSSLSELSVEICGMGLDGRERCGC